MTAAIPDFVPFEVAGKTLLAELDRLGTFQQVAVWDERAAELLATIDCYLESLKVTEAAVSAIAQRAREEHGKESAFRRMISSPPAVKAAASWKEKAEAARVALADLTEQLETAIDKTPNSPDDQRDMLRDLKLAKKELTLQKREASEGMRQVRAAARQKSAKVGTGFGLLLSTPTSRRYSSGL